MIQILITHSQTKLQQKYVLPFMQLIENLSRSSESILEHGSQLNTNELLRIQYFDSMDAMLSCFLLT